MPHLADIVFIIVIALAVFWKARCIWRGCKVPDHTQPGANDARNTP